METYDKYHSLVNVTYSQLLKFSKDKCSKLASLDRSPIKRNLHLLKTPREKWGEKEISWANKTISFISRMREVQQGSIVCSYEGQGMSKRDIALFNWAYRV